MLQTTRTVLWRLGALIALAVGIVGVVLPVVPTVPFLILAAWAAGKGWPALEQWLLAHSIYGPHIRRWRERGAVPRYAKIIATSMMLVSAVGLQFIPVASWLKAAVPITMVAVSIWLWRRPET